MKTLLKVAAIMALVAVLPLALQSKVKDTAHNLNLAKTSQPGGTNQVCLPCHTPHFSQRDATSGEASQYLWNHELSAGGWDLHAGADMDSVMNSGSRLCLSCHDGSVALDAFGLPETANTNGEKPISPGTVFIRAQKQIGPDLTNHHPIGVEYPLGNDRYEQPTISDPSDPSFDADFSVTSSDAGLSDPVGAHLVDSKVQCESCHFAHGSRATDTRMFLRVDNSESKLCSQCHVN